LIGGGERRDRLICKLLFIESLPLPKKFFAIYFFIDGSNPFFNDLSHISSAHLAILMDKL